MGVVVEESHGVWSVGVGDRPAASLKPPSSPSIGLALLRPYNIEYLHGKATITAAAGQLDLACSLASDLLRPQPNPQFLSRLDGHAY